MKTVPFAESGYISRFIAITVTSIIVAGIAFPLSMSVKISATGKENRLREE